jgi:neutral ceramidase
MSFFEGRARQIVFALIPVWATLGTAAIASADNGSLRAGAARVEITSLVKGDLPATGKYEHEKLFVRAIVLDNGSARAALLGADTSDMYEGVWKQASAKIAAELNCPVANVLMSATHTHSGGSPMGPAPSTSPYMTGLADAMVEAVRQAKAQLQPALAGFGTGMAYLNVNRDAITADTRQWTQASNLHASSDKTVAVLKFVKPTGEPIAVYVNYAMHPIDGYLLGFITADFPGAMCRYVEQVFDDRAVVVFSQGASGDQNPLYLRPSTNGLASMGGVPITGYSVAREPIEEPVRDAKVPVKPIDPAVRDRLERFIESEGQLLGEEVIRVMTETTSTSGDRRIWGAQKTVSCPGRKRTDSGREGMAGSYADAAPIDIRLGVLGVGNVALTSVNAEVYSRISLRMKSQSPLANTVMTTLGNGKADTGYIPDDESYGHQSFQVLGSHLKEGCAETAIADGITGLVNQYTQQ